MKTKYIFFFFLLFSVFSSFYNQVTAQEGHFISAWGGGQQTWLLNRDDYNGVGVRTVGSSDALLLDKTYGSAFGVDYIFNFDTSFGLQTGLSFSRQGQKYSGVFNIKDAAGSPHFMDFKSQVLIDYIKLPILFRFNSPLDEGDKYNMSLFAGFYFGYRYKVTNVSTTPAQDSLNAPVPDFSKFYKPLDFGFSGGAQMNIFLSKVIGLNFGLRYDRGFVNIEKQNYNFQRNFPAEWYFPLSVKKSIVPSPVDMLTRLPTRNTTVTLFLGLSFKIG